MFIAETLTNEARLDRVLQDIDFDKKWLVPKKGCGGGLVLFWKASINLTVEDSSKYYVDVCIDKNTEQEWRFTGFYGEPETLRRSEAWDSLHRSNHHPNTPWLYVGDFNELVRQDEKLGGAIRSNNQMQLFKDVLDECGFMDLGFVSPKFTWNRHFEDGRSIWERLDRGLANNAWFQKFPGSRVHHLRCDSLDHVPLFINLSGLEPPPRKKCFRFKEMWLSDNHCGETVEASWCSSISEIDDSAIIKKVERCGKDLAWWNRNIFGNVRLELRRKRKMLVQAEMEAMSSGLNFWVRELKHEINILLDREAWMWK